MARADLLKKLFSSYTNGDHESFLKAAHDIILDERKKNHALLADDLEMVLTHPSKSSKHSMTQMNTTITQRNDNEVKLVDIIYPDRYFDDVVLSDNKRSALEEIVHEYQNWDVLVSNGVSPINRLLFYGPPGCGKTLCANVLAAEIGIPIMYVRFDALVSSYLGETASNIRKVFDIAKNDSYVILFDEFDAIGRSRSDATEHGEIKRVVNTFLQQIDHFRGKSIIVAATNYEQSLDYAIWRRFDDAICFELPSNDEKTELFRLKLNQFNGPHYAFESLIDSTNGFSHADIDNICKTIMRKCILSGKRSYSRKDIEYALEKQIQMVSMRKSHY